MRRQQHDGKTFLTLQCAQGFERLLGEDSAEAIMAAFSFASQLPSYDDVISEYRRLWERARTLLPNDPITFDIVSEVRERERESARGERSDDTFVCPLRLGSFVVCLSVCHITSN